MSRCDIVKNGCSGKCCEAVFFPYTVDELRRIKEAKENKAPWVDEQGKERTDYPTDKLVSYDYLIDMLIPLGWQTVDPETKKTFRQIIDESPLWEGIEVTQDQLSSGKRLRDDGEVEGYIVTCKHFDTAKRICNDYENRPGLCRSFGATCKYAGCNYAKIAEDSIVKENANIVI